MRRPRPVFFLYETSLKKTSYFWYNEIRSNVSLCPKGYPDFFSGRDVFEFASRRPPSWIFIRNILFILPLGAEWMEWRSVHSGIGMQNRKTRVFYILAILIPELWIKKTRP